MESVSISDIMWNLRSAFQDVSFKDAETMLMKREQRLKEAKAEMEAKCTAVLLENGALKKQLDEFRRRRVGYKDTYQFSEKEKEKAREETGRLLAKIRRLEEENARVLRKIKGLEEAKSIAEKREGVMREENKKNLQRIGSLEKEKVETERREREAKLEAEKREGDLRGEIQKNLQRIGSLEKEKVEVERRDREVRGRIEKLLEEEREEAKRGERELLEKIECLEKDKEETERREREVREVDEHLQKIDSLEKEKEKLIAEAENSKKTLTKFKERIECLTKNPGMNMSSSQARSNLANDGGVEDKVDIDIIKEESNSQDSVHTPKLSRQITNPSMLVSSKPAATPIIHISDSDSDNDDARVHSPNRLKRKRDSSGGSNTRLEDKTNARFSDEELENASRSITGGHCSDEELAADASSPSWQFEADMLNAFEEDPVLTMEAVCALYRQQKSCGLGYGLGLLRNRGFDAVHAFRGIALAEFLVDGNPRSDMKKSMEELQIHDPKGLDDCKSIASAHSGKLFEIYQTQEDPFFGPE